MNSALQSVLSSFTSITLAEMDGVKLLDRTDTKFLFNYDQLPSMLEQIKNHYKILDVDGIKRNRYETLYFDTPGLNLYLDHHNGRKSRYKVRYRKYTDSGLVFFEVKFKNNKGRTIKSRIKREDIHDVVEGRSIDLINERTPLAPENLQSVLWVNYSRLTLVSKNSTERLTIDLDLHFKKGDRTVKFNNLVIAEVKQEKTCASRFIELMKQEHIREGSISKYCFGVAILIDEIKKNNFKSHLLTVNKLCHATIH